MLGSKEDLAYLLEKNSGKTSGLTLCTGADDLKFVYETLGNPGGSRHTCLTCFLIACWLVELLRTPAIAPPPFLRGGGGLDSSVLNMAQIVLIFEIHV